MPIWLIDTNLLLRYIQPEAAHYPQARAAINRLAAEGHQMCVVAQIIAEFWVVATRPADANGLGWTPEAAAAEVEALLSRFVLLLDTPLAFPRWLDLVRMHQVRGKKAHDARLVAAMQAYGVEHLLTFSVDDFAAYSEIKAVHPSSVAAGVSDG